MGRIHRWTAALAAGLLAALALPLTAQEKAAPSAVGMLAPAAPSAAVTEFRAGFDGFHLWAFGAAVDHAQKALGTAPSFGLARAYLAQLVGGPSANAELDRAVVDAARSTPAEALLTMAYREANAFRYANARKLLDAAVALAPNDPGVAVERALFLSGAARIDALREVTKKFVDDAPSRMWLAYYLTEQPTGFSRTDAAEALELAQAALRITPNEPGAITAVAHALERLGRHDEALTYLDRATEANPPSLYGITLRAEILWREGKPAEARQAFDLHASLTPIPVNAIQARRAMAVVTAYEGKPREALQELAAVADQAETAGFRFEAGLTHITAALIAGGAREGDLAQKEIAAARALGLNSYWVDEDEVLALAWGGRPSLARQALAAVQKSSPLTGLARENRLRMLNGVVLVAEDKAADAVPELKADPESPIAQLALVEAYRKLGKKAEANLARKTILERKDFRWDAVTIPVAFFRLK